MDSSLILKSKVSNKRAINLDIAVSTPIRSVPLTESPDAPVHGVALLDTGASMSLVCKNMLQKLNLMPLRTVGIIGPHGEEVESDTYLIDLHFVYNDQISRTIQRLEVATLGNSTSLQVLLGMDVLTKNVKKFSLMGEHAEIHF